MKKSIVGILALGGLAISIAAASCAQPAPAALKPQPAPTTPAVQVPTAPIGDVHQALEGLEAQRLATQAIFDECIKTGQPLPDLGIAVLESFEQTRLAFEEVRPALEALEAQRLATQAIFSECIARGQPFPDLGIAILESIEQQRLALLRSVGLAN